MSNFYESWMNSIRDDVRLKDIVMPGSHNAGTYEMIPFAKCQGASLWEQYRFGVRFFDFRFHIGISGKPVFEHGIMGGSFLSDGLRDIRRMLLNNDSEFFIFDVHFPSEETLIWKITRRFNRDFSLINSLFEEYIEPSRYAFTDFDNIGSVTMGDLRKSGKRYILNFRGGGIDFSGDASLYSPWRPDYHGMKTHDFFEKTLSYFDSAPENGLFCFFTQRTPGVGTEEGLKNPSALEKDVRNNYHILCEKIENNPRLLSKANILAGDYMTESHFKVNKILHMNLAKNNIKDENIEEFKDYVKV